MSVTREPASLDEQSTTRQPVGRRSLNPSQLRELIPADGLREYWYPLTPERRIPRTRPRGIRLLGTTVAAYRGRQGEVVAVADACPHRGGSLSHGNCRFAGTLTCPYHGWTFDADGQCVAVLGEGPESRIPGMREANVRKYPTRTLKGMVFVWMGEGPPAPIEEDVPPQFFDDSTLVQHSVTTWDCNWRPAFENLLDAHVFYVHRNSMELILLPEKNLLTMSKLGPRRPKPYAVNRRGLMYRAGQLAFISAFVNENGDSEQAARVEEDEPAAPKSWPPRDEFRDAYPGLDNQLWPRGRRRLYWHRAVGAVRNRFSRSGGGAMVTDPEWHDAHLPSTFQVDYSSHIYTRTTVPIDTERSRIFYFHTTRPRSSGERLANIAYFRAWKNWSMNYNFSGQDAKVVQDQYYDQPEKFSATDTFPLALRRFIVENGRDFLRSGEALPPDEEQSAQ